MPLSRRKTLALIGGGVVAAATPAAAFLATRTPTRALAPWDTAGDYPDARLRALSFALLAPNPHNRQPWLAELSGDDAVAIWRDPTRDLPVTDPFARQLTIGMGCFLELMDMAAAAEGIGVETELFPDGEAGPVARCRLVPGAGDPDPLFAHVLERRSHKKSFADRPVTAVAAAPLAPLADLVLEGADRDTLRRIAHDAWITEMATPAALDESIDLLRIGKAEIEANPDGIDVGGPVMDTLAVLGILTHAAAADPDNPGTKAVVDATSEAIRAAPGFVLMRTGDNAQADQIAAGRRWLRLNLAATGAGLALRPVSQALQEYAEVRPYHDEIHARFAAGGETVQMLGLLGYGARTPRTPRWPLETRMRHA